MYSFVREITLARTVYTVFEATSPLESRLIVEIRGNQITTRSNACILSRTNTVFVSRSVIDLATPGRQKESFRARYYVQRYRRKYFFSHRSFGPPSASIDVSFATSRGAENAHTFPFFSFFFFAVGNLMVSSAIRSKRSLGVVSL